MEKGPTWEDNKDKAEEMAYAEDPMREKASIAKALGLDDQIFAGIARDEGRRAGEQYEKRVANLKTAVDKILKEAIEGRSEDLRIGNDWGFTADQLEEALRERIGESLKDRFIIVRNDSSEASFLRVDFMQRFSRDVK